MAESKSKPPDFSVAGHGTKKACQVVQRAESECAGFELKTEIEATQMQR